MAGHRGRAAVAIAGLCAAFVLAGCSRDNKSSDSSTRASSEAATAELGPLPPDLAAAKAWMVSNDERVDEFQRVAAELTAPALPADCAGLAERFNAELGPLADYLKAVAASPDPVLAELLTSAAISARTMVAACAASETAVADDERPGLANALMLIERRQAELKA